jgi:hypothetical protein
MPPTRSQVMAMSDSEFRDACRRRVWRGEAATNALPQSAPSISRPDTETRQHARDMTDAEFEEANRRKGWRVGVPSR